MVLKANLTGGLYWGFGSIGVGGGRSFLGSSGGSPFLTIVPSSFCNEIFFIMASTETVPLSTSVNAFFSSSTAVLNSVPLTAAMDEGV